MKTTQSSRNILFFGSYSSDYARTWTLRKCFERMGATILEINCGELRGVKKYRYIWQEFMKIRGKFDFVVVPFPGFVYFPLIWILTRKPIVYDALISLYETDVDDRRYFKKWSLGGIRSYLLDWIACKGATVLLTDTQACGDYFVETFHCDPTKIHRVWTGTNRDKFFPINVEKDDKVFTLAFQGKVVDRITGLKYIVEAMERLNDEKGLQLKIIGPEDRMASIKKMVKSKGLKNIIFTGWISMENLVAELGKCHILISSFGNTNKLKKAIPLKVWDALAMKMPIIAGETPGLKEAFRDKKHLLYAKLADPGDLAEKILLLKNDPSLREKIAKTGYDYFNQELSIKKIARQLEKDLKRHLL